MKTEKGKLKVGMISRPLRDRALKSPAPRELVGTLPAAWLRRNIRLAH